MSKDAFSTQSTYDIGRSIECRRVAELRNDFRNGCVFED